MKAQAKARIEADIGVVDTMHTPEQSGCMEGSVLPVNRKIERNQGQCARHCLRNRCLVEQPDAARLCPAGDYHPTNG